jgi:hypothetical protein
MTTKERQALLKAADEAAGIWIVFRKGKALNRAYGFECHPVAFSVPNGHIIMGRDGVAVLEKV